jgi:chemotaxis protein MotA
MDPITIIGIVGGLIAVLASAMWEGTKLGALLNPSAALIILGGTTGATMACYSFAELKMLFGSLKLIIAKSSADVGDIFSTFGELATLARRDGLLVLENYPIKINSPILKRGIKLLVDGTEPNLLKDLLSTELATLEQKIKGQAGVFQTAGGFSPTMGIIGTVMGLVNVLGNLEDPGELGPAISVAFLATLYGIGFANLVLLPLGKKLTFVAKQETQAGLLIIEGLIAIQSGDNPRVVQEKLLSFIDEKDWEPLRRRQGKVKEAA